MKKMHIHTYGCQMNDYESDRTYRLFHEMFDLTWTDHPQEADVVLFNTCSIREKADQKAFSAIGELGPMKKKNPSMVIAVGGCLAQSQGAEIQERFPFVDIVFGTHQWASLPDLVRKTWEKREIFSELDLFSWKNYAFLPYRESNAPHPVSELVTIQNGCDKFCTFCLVPFTRGRQVSRSPLEIVAEVESLCRRGVKEITLLGQNVNAYGVDRRGEMSFADLLRRMDSVQGLERLRFVTSHPSELTFEAIDVMASSKVVCEHLHFPLQSGSDRILEKMNRDYTLKQYAKTVAYLREKIPDLALTTDIIVGFPGEEEEDFNQTLMALETFAFDDSYSFCFSPRQNTKAALWSEAFVNRDVAKERLIRFQSRQKEITQETRQSWLGRSVEVLVEGFSKRDPKRLYGKTRQNTGVNFEGSGDLVGQMAWVKLLDLGVYTYKGEVLPSYQLPVRVA